MLIVLMAVTFPLWVDREPLLTVPFISIDARVLHGMSWILFLAVLAACGTVLWFGERVRSVWWIVTIALGISFLLNQHRLQPWAYQSALYATVFAAMPFVKARRFLVPLAASVYLYSGLGKLDYQFAYTVGQDFLSAINIPGLGNLQHKYSLDTLAKISLALPAAEILIALGLIFSRTRRIAGIFLIGLHGTLILILGPWNLNHSLGVLFWNVLLIVQAWFLFVRKSAVDAMDDIEGERQAVTQFIPKILFVLALVMPLTERWGYWDHWLSWALYAPHTSRAVIEIHQTSLESLPQEMNSFLQEEDGDGWYRLDQNRWSLEVLGVPIYPQARFQLAVAARIAEQCDLKDGIRVMIRETSDRRTGNRIEKRLLGAEEILSAAN